jgi:lipopolysaccharide export system permease protein
MFGSGRLEGYILTRTLAAVGAALAVISAVIMLIDLVELSRNLGSRADVGFARLVGLTFLKSPSVILLLLPFVFLFGTLAAYVILNRRSELIALRAAGVSAWRFILPATAAAFICGVLTITVLNPIAAQLNSSFEDARAQIMQGVRRGVQPETWLREGDERTQIVIHADHHDIVGGSIRLQGVSVFVYAVAPGGATTFSRRIEAAQAVLLPGLWRLSDVREAAPGEGSIRSETLSLPSMLDQRSALERFSSPEGVDLWRLPRVIRNTEQAGFSAVDYRLRLQTLLASPVLFAAMALLAAAFSLRLARLGGLSGLAVLAVASGFGVYFFSQFCGALGSAEVIPVWAAAWIPPTMAFLSGLALLCYTEDG